MKVYLDVCCLNRPFDDQTHDRIRLEREAVLAIISRCQTGNWLLVGSEAIDIEVSRIPDREKRQKVGILYSISQSNVIVGADVEKRAIDLENLGFNPFDALHISCAEKSRVDVLLTTDDRLLRKAVQNKDVLNVKVRNPVKWLIEVI